jgi:hypothetical protein
MACSSEEGNHIDVCVKEAGRGVPHGPRRLWQLVDGAVGTPRPTFPGGVLPVNPSTLRSCNDLQKLHPSGHPSEGVSDPLGWQKGRRRFSHFLSNSCQSKAFISELTFYYEMTQEHRVRSIQLFLRQYVAAIHRARRRWDKLYPDYVESITGTVPGPRLPAPWTAVICNRAAFKITNLWVSTISCNI